MIIIGAGMSGLLAGGMIRDEPVSIWETATKLPNNHSAVLRFRSSVVGDTLDIEFKKVKMMKCVHTFSNPVADALSYSFKCNGTYSLRSITTADGEIAERFIAPPDLISKMADRVNGPIYFGNNFSLEAVDSLLKEGRKIISTIPMPTLMDILQYPEEPEFKYVHGFNVIAEIEGLNAYCSVYDPRPIDLSCANRISATGNLMTIECSFPGSSIDDVQDALESTQLEDFAGGYAEMLGIYRPYYVRSVTAKLQKYSKILPIDEKIRKNFIMWATEKYGIYSLGRFATWRPGLLMDDVVNDVRVIRSIIKNGKYEHMKR